MISFNIQTLLGDVYGNNFDSSWCIFRGYFICVTTCTTYHAFVIQVNNEKEYIVNEFTRNFTEISDEILIRV
jgi:hypothetical protein